MIPLPELIPICQQGRWGYIDRSARLVINPSFTLARPFHNGLACVNEGGHVGRNGNDVAGGKWGYIDASGSYAFAARFDDACDFSEGFAAVNVGARVKYAAHDDFYYSLGGKWGLIDTTGAFTVQPKYDFLGSVQAALATANERGKCGFLRANGEWHIAPRFDGASPFHESLAAVKLGKLYGYIDASGEFRVEPRFELAYDFHDGLAAGHTADPYLWMFIDAQGNVRFTAPEGTAHVGNFSEGLIMANLCALERFSDGRIYPKSLRRSLGYLNGNGAWVIPPQFAWGGSFREGLAWVKRDEGPYAYIRNDGSFLAAPDLDDAGSFDGGLAPVRIGGKFALLDRTGKPFWIED